MTRGNTCARCRAWGGTSLPDSAPAMVTPPSYFTTEHTHKEGRPRPQCWQLYPLPPPPNQSPAAPQLQHWVSILPPLPQDHNSNTRCPTHHTRLHYVRPWLIARFDTTRWVSSLLTSVHTAQLKELPGQQSLKIELGGAHHTHKACTQQDVSWLGCLAAAAAAAARAYCTDPTDPAKELALSWHLCAILNPTAKGRSNR